MPLKALGLGRPPRGHPDRIGPVQGEILAFVTKRPQDAHGVGIARHLRSAIDPDIPDAQAYVALKRLEARGYLVAQPEEVTTASTDTPSKRSRGRPRKLYSLTSSGRRALNGAGVNNSGSAPGDSQQGEKEKFSDDSAIQATPVVG